MGDLQATGAAIHARLGAKHEAREAALRASRAAIRASAKAIRAAHRGELHEADALIAESSAQLREAGEAVFSHPSVRWAGFVHDAEKEHAEARLTVAALRGEDLPGPLQMGVADTAWLNGLAETIGELRRFLLHELRAGRVADSERLLDTMDEIYSLLVTMDFPDGITDGLRRSTDVARSILERTRGDLTTALVQDRLRRAIEERLKPDDA